MAAAELISRGPEALTMLRVVAYYLAGIAAPGVLLVGVWGMLSACLVYAADYGWQGGMAAGGVAF